MSNIEIKRDFKGNLELHVAGQPALGVQFTNMQVIDGKPVAFFAIPLQHATFGEASSVIPFVPRP